MDQGNNLPPTNPATPPVATTPPAPVAPGTPYFPPVSNPAAAPTPPPAPATPPVAPTTPPATPPVAPATPPTTPPAPVTPPVAPTTPPAAPPAPAPAPVDVAAMKEEVSKGILSKLGEALGFTKKQSDKLPTDPAELKAYIDKSGTDAAKAILKEREDADAKAQKAYNESITQGGKEYQELWTRDFSELVKLGHAPAIVNPADANDPGIIARTKIMVKIKEIMDQNKAAGLDIVPTMWEIMSRFPNVLTLETTTGANVPISGGGGNAPTTTPDYDRIHSTPIETMVADKHKGKN